MEVARSDGCDEGSIEGPSQAQFWVWCNEFGDHLLGCFDGPTSAEKNSVSFVKDGQNLEKIGVLDLILIENKL